MFVRSVSHKSNRATIKRANHSPVANTAAVVTVNASSGFTHTVHGVQWSYSTSPTGGNLLITSNGVTLYSIDITASGPGGFNFAIPGTPNQNVVVTLASGTGSCVGKLNVQYVTEG